MKTHVTATSVINFYTILNELGKRQKLVLQALKHLKVANNLQISRYLGLPINSVTPRMNELRKKGIVIYHHTAMCPLSNRLTRFFIIKGYLNEVLQC